MVDKGSKPVLRPVLAVFSQAMERELRSDDYKDGLSIEEEQVKSAVERWLEIYAFAVYEDADTAREDLLAMVNEWAGEWVDSWRK